MGGSGEDATVSGGSGSDTANSGWSDEAVVLESADTFGLESAEATGMPNARTDISGGSAKLEASLKRLGITLVASDATCITPRNTGVASMTTGDSADT